MDLHLYRCCSESLGAYSSLGAGSRQAVGSEGTLDAHRSLPAAAAGRCVCKGVLPIPGAKNAAQLNDIAGAVGWRLDEGEVAELDKLSAGPARSSVGAPFENW